MKDTSLLILNLLVIVSFVVILAHSVIGMIAPPAGHLYFGSAAYCQPAP